MSVMYDKVALIGLGLIASSMAHAMRRAGMETEIVGTARSPETRETAQRLGFCDRVTETAAEAVKGAHPEQMLAYNCSPSFNWSKHMDEAAMAKFQRELGAMGYKYQFITLAGIHNMWFNMFELAHDYAKGEGMRHYVEKVQRPEFQAAEKGYTFVAHQQEVGTGYFDKMTNTIQGGNSSVTALTGSTEEDQF